LYPALDRSVGNDDPASVGRDLPAGTVTFLFTDVEGSTRFLHELGVEAYAAALAEHRRLVREACSAHGGVEVDTQGDAFFVAFPTAAGAIDAAREITAGLASGPIRVRVGLHTGTPLVTDEGYVGSDVNRAARIAASGHGGQVLVSSSTASLIDKDGLLDLGDHRFKDLSAPERVYQLGEQDFPALKSLYRTNLPVPATPFLGRERELEEVVTLLNREDVRLLTLTGPGGTGKTRLALQAAAEASDHYPDGITWAPLAPLRDPALLLPAVMQGLELNEEPGTPLTATLATALAGKRTLLVLDNVEHLLPRAAADVATLRDLDGPNVLVTSRERLRVGGEQAWPVPSLAESDAVELFTARALAVDPSFVTTAATAELCTRLDDLPLAIELAAGRTGLFSTDELLERLSQRLDLLQGDREADPRQQTLRATIEWSYDLLPPEERRLFRSLSVFTGGCTFDTAEVVCSADADTLQSLIDKSLVRKRPTGRGSRYWMLETIREFALERLDAGGEALRLQHLHAEHYLALSEREWPELRGPTQAAALGRLESEHANLRAAIAWACAQGQAELALRLAAFLWRFWWVRGLLSEGRRWLSMVLALPVEGLEAVRATVLEGAAALAWGQADAESAEVHAESALELFRRIDDKRGVARALNHLGLVSQERGAYERARGFFDESGTLARELGNERGYAVAVVNLGGLALIEGDYAGARELSELGLRLHREHHSRDGEAISLLNLGFAALEEGAAGEARKQLEESCELFRELGFTEYHAFSLEGLAGVAALSGAPVEAARLLGHAEALREAADASLGPFERRLHKRTLAAVHERLDATALAEAWREGRADADRAAAAATR
jgi:predicted ATPase/class 3 adenylate cyclase